jgi:hypothetical protein
MLKYLGKQMGHVISESNPYVTNMASWTHLRDQEFQKEYALFLPPNSTCNVLVAVTAPVRVCVCVRVCGVWCVLTVITAACSAFDYRVARLLHNTAQLLQKRAKNNDFFTAWNQTRTYTTILSFFKKDNVDKIVIC